MIEYFFNETGLNENWDDFFNTNDGFEHCWWLENNVEDFMLNGKKIFGEENSVVIPSYTYSIVYTNTISVEEKVLIGFDVEGEFNNYLQVGIYKTSLEYVIGVHLKEMESVTLFLEVYEVHECPEILSDDIKKIYIVKMRVYEFTPLNERDLLNAMEENIIVDNSPVLFKVYENCIACTPLESPFFSNAYEYVIANNARGICFDKIKVPLIAISDDWLTSSCDASHINIDFKELKKVVMEVFKRENR